MSYLKARNDSASTVGLEILLSVAFGFLAGRWLDEKLGTQPYITIVGFLFGMATAGRFLVRAARRMKSRTDADGFRPADTDRDARFALEQKEKRRRDEP